LKEIGEKKTKKKKRKKKEEKIEKIKRGRSAQLYPPLLLTEQTCSIVHLPSGQLVPKHFIYLFIFLSFFFSFF